MSTSLDIEVVINSQRNWLLLEEYSKPYFQYNTIMRFISRWDDATAHYLDEFSVEYLWREYPSNLLFEPKQLLSTVIDESIVLARHVLENSVPCVWYVVTEKQQSKVFLRFKDSTSASLTRLVCG